MSLLILGWPMSAAAVVSSSANYSVSQVEFGAGGIRNACSASYCADQTLGDTAAGNPSSANYQAHAGFTTTQQPFLYFVVNATSTDLGYLSTSSTATANGTFSVRTYDAGGYAVQTVSPPPTSTEGHTLAVPSSPTAPAPGTELFGMNLVANTVPTTFGANPVITADSGAAAGQVAANYDTANKFMYHQGDTIASSATPGNTTGQANYTISYVFDISSGTPAGLYNFNDNLVATATY